METCWHSNGQRLKNVSEAAGCVQWHYLPGHIKQKKNLSFAEHNIFTFFVILTKKQGQ